MYLKFEVKQKPEIVEIVQLLNSQNETTRQLIVNKVNIKLTVMYNYKSCTCLLTIPVLES